VVKPAGDGWSASCPVLEKYGAFTLGASREEVLNDIQRVVQGIVGTLGRDRRPIPQESAGEATSRHIVTAVL
jgi:predicted RNase H-like HicB family nuclease